MRNLLNNILKQYNLLIYMKSYCVKEKRVTDCVPNSERYVRAKNGRLMLQCKCVSCGIIKTKFVKNQGN